MPKTSWQRTLTIVSAQLREEAALSDEAAREEEADRALSLRGGANALREAARLLDDAEAMIVSALGSLERKRTR